MELSQVVSPHFAVPVFGVVICALLVFAFGFKSPVQPPSFDFGEDDKNSKKKKIRSKKKATNSQAVTSEVSSAPPAAATKAAAPVKAAKPEKKEEVKKEKVTSKKEKQQSSQKTVAKKNEPVAKSAKKSAEKSAEKENFEDQGWTTAVPKKQRKQKAKKEDLPEEPIKEAQTPVTKEKSPTVSAQKKSDESPKKTPKKPVPLNMTLEEGEIRDDTLTEIQYSSIAVETKDRKSPPKAKQADSATAPNSGKKTSNPSPTDIKQGWEFVDSTTISATGQSLYELEEGEIIDESIIEALFYLIAKISL